MPSQKLFPILLFHVLNTESTTISTNWSCLPAFPGACCCRVYWSCFLLPYVYVLLQVDWTTCTIELDITSKCYCNSGLYNGKTYHTVVVARSVSLPISNVYAGNPPTLDAQNHSESLAVKFPQETVNSEYIYMSAFYVF